MDETVKHVIVVNTLMTRVQQELARRSSPDRLTPYTQSGIDIPAQAVRDEFLITHEKQTAVWRFMKKMQFRLQQYAIYDFVYYRIAVKIKNLIPKFESQFTVSDLLRHDDEEFVRNAYVAILQREADDQERTNYLMKLRKRRLSKRAILAILRYSKEGREQRVRIKDIRSLWLLRFVYKIPLVGNLMSRI